MQHKLYDTTIREHEYPLRFGTNNAKNSFATMNIADFTITGSFRRMTPLSVMRIGQICSKKANLKWTQTYLTFVKNSSLLSSILKDGFVDRVFLRKPSPTPVTVRVPQKSLDEIMLRVRKFPGTPERLRGRKEVYHG
jgi:hypothetical protein